METKKWEALLTASEKGSFTKAAEALGYTQSGMTYLINSLEEECGVVLLERSWSGVKLSEEGEALLGDIRALTEADERLQRKLAAFARRQESQISIGAYSSISVHWLAGAISLFQRERPDVHVELLIGAKEELTEWLQRGKIDLALSDDLHLPFGAWKELYVEPLYAVLPKEHPAAGAAAFVPEDAGALPFLPPPDSSAGDNDLSAFSKHHSGLNLRAEDDIVTLSMVAHGVGYSLLPDLTLRGRTELVALAALKDPIYRRLGINRRTSQPLSKTYKRLFSLIKKNIPPDLFRLS